jgi:hypothetical protein
MTSSRLIKAESQAFKVLISGAFATGKSTLCRLLVKRVSDAGISAATVGEIPRRCPFALNREQTPLASAWLIGEQIRSEVEASVGTHRLLVCDRGLPDIVSHSIGLELDERNRQLNDVLIAIARTWSKTYDLVFWATVDPDRPIEDDGARVVDKQYQLLLEERIGSAFHSLSLHPLRLPREIEDRYLFMKRSLDAHMRPGSEV